MIIIGGNKYDMIRTFLDKIDTLLPIIWWQICLNIKDIIVQILTIKYNNNCIHQFFKNLKLIINN